jgi:PAS domain S-box-containing protein
VTGTYDPGLVALSYLIATAASYVALDLASRVSMAQGRVATYWLLGGAMVMGIGIWSMHFIGMLAFHLPIPTSYDIPITMLSMSIAVVASGIALFTISRKTLGWGKLMVSGALMGVGIAGMHYTGMAAMKMLPSIRYDIPLLALSIAIAIGASMVALWVGFRLRYEAGSAFAWKRAGSALVMGVAIAGMHYTGMSAAEFDANSICLAGPQRVDNVWLAVTVACCAALLLAGTKLIRVGDSSEFATERHAMSIRLQILVGFLVTGALVLTVIMAALWAQLEAAERAAVAEARNYARTIAVANGETAISNPSSVQDQITNMHKRDGRDTFVVDSKLRIVADSNLSEVGKVFVGDAIGKTIVDGQPRTFDEIEEFPRRVIKQLVAPLRRDASDPGGAIVGAVIVEYTPIYEALQADAWAMTKTIASFGVAIIFVTFILGARIASAIASPIVELTRGAIAVAAGNYSARVKVQSSDEIGTLAAAFNGMAEDLSTSHALLVEHRRELEERVAQRTAEWQQAKETAEESSAELRLITDLIPVSLCYIDRDQRYRYHNRKRAEWTDFAGEIDGQTVAEVMGAESYAFARDWIKQALAGRQVSYERPNRTRDGTLQTVATHLTPRLGSDGGVIGYYAMSQDISERKRAEEALQQRNEELKAINLKLHEAYDRLLQAGKMASIGQLASGVAHEINNPIGYVHSNLRTLDRYLNGIFTLLDAYQVAEAALVNEAVQTELKSAKQAADIAFVRVDVLALLSESKEGITRVAKIVQDLKNFSRSSSDEDWQWADIHEGIDSTLSIVSNELKYKADVSKQYGELPLIQCRPSQLNQVFMNLLVNGADAIKERGTITIGTGAEDGKVWIEFADTGEGIRPENISRVFDPFFTTKPVGKGTGLGLSVSYGIVREHDGRIDVRSEVGKGTVFRVWLPITQADRGDPAASKASAADATPADEVTHPAIA